MTLRLRIDVSGDFAKMVDNDKKRLASVLTAGMREAGNQIKAQGRASIAKGGFSSRWQNALRADVYPKTGVSTSPAVSVYHKIGYAGQFEDPQPVSGSPLLWLPIEENLPLQARGKRWTPHDFVNNVGPLKSGKHGGKPLLFGQVRVGQSGGVLALPSARSTRTRFGKQKQQWLPVFVGVSSVTDPKRFDIRGVVERVGSQLEAIFASKWDKS